ncbi:MAG: GTPase [Planctomycetota bacterium]
MSGAAWLRVMTPVGGRAGGVSIVQVGGAAGGGAVERLTGRALPAAGGVGLRRFGEIDDGLVGVVEAPEGVVIQLMPHGGAGVLRALVGALKELGVGPVPEGESALAIARRDYPEARSGLEAEVLAAVARAASPAAVGLLAEQVGLWMGRSVDGVDWGVVEERSRVLDRLIEPATVVVVGPPNAGKSTLTNRLLGRRVSVVSGRPGTTRDWVGGVVELRAGVAVRWLDTPGLRAGSGDVVEERAVGAVAGLLESAAVVVGMSETGFGDEAGWMGMTGGREIDVWVHSKRDDAGDASEDRTGLSAERPLAVSAETGVGIERLEALVVERLGLSAVGGELWAFTPTLRRVVAGEVGLLPGYVGLGADQ